MIRRAPTKITLKIHHTFVYLLFRTENTSATKPPLPSYRATYTSPTADNAIASSDARYSWAQTIGFGRRHILVGIGNTNPTEHPRFHAQETALPIELGHLVEVMEAKVKVEQKELEDNVGRAVVEWTVGDMGSKAYIVVGEGEDERFVWWEIMRCNVY